MTVVFQKKERRIMKKKMLEEASKRIRILQEMGLWDEVERVWQEGTPCYSKPMELMGEMTGINFTFNESSEMKALKEKV